LGIVERDNLGEFIRRAASHPPARRLLEKAGAAMGRCPKGEKGWFRGQLVVRPETSSQADVAPRTLEEGELELRDLSGSIGELPRLIDRVGALPASLDRLQIRLADFTYATGLAVLAEWILAHYMVNRYEFVECSPEMERYLEGVRFQAALRNPGIVISQDPMDWAVGLTRINRDQPTEKVTEKIVDILQTFVNPTPEDAQAMLVLISEMIENVHRHAESPVDGFAVAQVYPKRLKMGITLVDAGIGVRESFERGTPSVPIDALKTDGDFLRLAVRLHSTSKRERHSGYGLYLLAELVARNRGTFLLTSGTSTLVGYRRHGVVEYEERRHRPWRGTIVSVILDLNKALPLLDIYRQMPAPAGIVDDDFFVA
jgi:anti-sigma regulatory factor (Ser/Thr protein kinase)